MNKRTFILPKLFVALAISAATAGMRAQSKVANTSKTPKQRGTPMTQSTTAAQPMSPDAERYLRGVTPENLQFDFLIGDWDVAASRYKADGSLLMQYQGKWTAHYLNGKRMIFDDFKSVTSAGEEISSFITLRTYSETSHRWEMAGLAAFQPQAAVIWYGRWKDGEMQTEVIGKDPTGNSVRNQIRFFSIEKGRFS